MSFAFPLILSSLVAIPACTSAESDELAGEADAEDTVDGKADAADGVHTYFELSGDTRRCAYPMCGGFHLDRLNASSTTCHDSSRAESCYTPVLDFSQSGLDQAKQDALRLAASKGAFEGVFAIVRGRFAKTNSTTPRPEMGRFIVTEAWVAEGEGVSDGVFAKVADSGIRCIAAPCPSLRERALNASRSAAIAEVDFAAGDLSEASVASLGEDLFKPGGIIIAGDRFTVSVDGRTGKGRTATNAYRNLANVAAGGECFVGGCSGQACSDNPNVITTCEWRPEYACYQQATCERQADGECGWTQTPELLACIGE